MSRSPEQPASGRRHTVVVLAENRDGILARITALFAARGYVVESIAVGPALDTSVLRMVLVVQGDEAVVEQVTKQLRKLIEVIKVTDLTDAPHIEREMLLVRVAARGENRAEIARIADIFRGKIVDQAADTYVVEISGESSKVDSALELLRPFGIHEIVRTGKIAMARGVGLRPSEATSSVRGRKHARHPVGFEVRVASLESPSRLRARDISAGGMSLRTKSDVAVGTTLAMQIVHPVSGQQFPLSAVVRRHIVQPDFRGLGVEFVELDEANRQRLDEFMSSEAAAADESE